MDEELVPIFRVDDGRVAAAWYERLGFAVIGEHRFAPDLPLYLFMRRGDVHLHLSEHTGDAPLRSLAYFYVEDVDAIASKFDEIVKTQPWGREIELTDPSGNRLRIGTVRAGPDGVGGSNWAFWGAQEDAAAVSRWPDRSRSGVPRLVDLAGECAAGTVRTTDVVHFDLSPANILHEAGILTGIVNQQRPVAASDRSQRAELDHCVPLPPGAQADRVDRRHRAGSTEEHRFMHIATRVNDDCTRHAR